MTSSTYYPFFTAFLLLFTLSLSAQVIQDDFEGNGNIETWFGDDCVINTSAANPSVGEPNPSATVLSYQDTGGQYANVRFQWASNFPMQERAVFSCKVYVSATGLTGNQPLQVSLKLQDGTQEQPWETQTEIIKSLVPDQWQTVTFDFAEDPYINLNGGSPPPLLREDFNRVVIQFNGENNNDPVTAYVDDFYYDGTPLAAPIYDALVWSDEFEEDGALDATKWFPQTQIPNGQSWFNGEIQHYTDRLENAFVENGALQLTARRETYTNDGVTKQFTSARLNSKFAFTYGRVEVRAKLPRGVGTWPAIWLLGQNITETGAYWTQQGFGTTSWPACGEIDVMEHWGDNQNFVQSATHTPSSFGNTENKGGRILPTASDEFHVYGLQWTPERLAFSVDGQVHYIYEPDVQNSSTWPFDANMYLLLNIAILPEIASSFSSGAMEIDYVRVYQESSTATVELPEEERLMVYPNPVDDTLWVTFPTAAVGQYVQLEWYDGQGRLLRTEKELLLGQQLQLDTRKLSVAGTYFLVCSWGETRHQIPIVKQ
ncbi:MAG: family 16 glycosylhydrolase [Bacteroidota bacterium]